MRRTSKGQDALDDQHGGGLDAAHLVRAVVNGVVVHRAVHRAAGLQRQQLLDQQVVVEGVGMVVVQQAALFIGQLVVALVVAVMGDQAHLFLPEAGFQPQGQGGLAAAGAACDADDQTVHDGSSPHGLAQQAAL